MFFKVIENSLYFNSTLSNKIVQRNKTPLIKIRFRFLKKKLIIVM